MGQAVSPDGLDESPLLRIAGLRKRYGHGEVLCGVDLDLMAGKIVALVGDSGAGKSTLLRCVGGLEGIQAGALTLHGRPLPQGGHRRVAWLFQGQNLTPQLSVGANVMLAACGAGQARDVLARVGLAAQFGAMPAELSAAQHQRVVLARAVATEPALLLCDDIASSADPELAGEVAAALRALAFDGLAVLLATPDLAFAHSVADRVVLLRNGRVLAATFSSDEVGAPPSLQLVPQERTVGRIADVEQGAIPLGRELQEDHLYARRGFPGGHLLSLSEPSGTSDR